MLLATAVLTLPLCAQSLNEVENTLHDENNRQNQTPLPSKERACKGRNVSFFPDDDTSRLEYTYSRYFQFGLNAIYTTSFLATGIEYGFNMDKQKFACGDTDYYNPKVALMYSLGGHFKYISASCGIGVLLGSYTENRFSQTIVGDAIATTSKSTTNTKAYFMVRPSLTGHIPIVEDEYYITLNLGYYLVPKFKKFNGPSFGIGFQFVFD